MAISFLTFYKEFEERHNFKSSDIKILKRNYPNIKFFFIPEAWIPLIDQLLRKIDREDPGFLVSVSQYYGFLSLEFSRSPSLKQRNYISKIEKLIYDIDVDLRILLDIEVKDVA